MRVDSQDIINADANRLLDGKLEKTMGKAARLGRTENSEL
jgi:hypothetical protein